MKSKDSIEEEDINEMIEGKKEKVILEDHKKNVLKITET
jgi:hypothetical protein